MFCLSPQCYRCIVLDLSIVSCVLWNFSKRIVLQNLYIDFIPTVLSYSCTYMHICEIH